MSLSTVFYSIQRNIFRIGGPILVTIGSISSILNIMIFSKGSLRKSPCTICLISVNIINFFYFYLGILLTILAVGYDIDPSSTNISFCRFRYYLALVFAGWESSCIILASIDRTLTTSRNATTRNLSTRRFIAMSMSGIGLFWILFHIHVLIFMNILQFGPNYFVCFYQPGIYTTFMSYYQFLINGIFPPVIMAIFGFLTVKNIRGLNRVNHHSRITDPTSNVVNRPYAIQSKDKQLIRMLLVDIIVFIICKCPATLFLIYQEITQYNEKTSEQYMIEQSILQLTYFIYFIENSISCYTNILVSKTFRAEMKRMFLNARHFFFQNPD